MWEQIAANRRRSVILILCMAILLIAMGWAFGELFAGPGYGILGVPVALGILGVQLLIYRFAAESLLLQGTNARELSREDSPRLFNIVEEMMLASGQTSMPRIFLIDDSAPNAFAMGRRPEHSSITVTTGLLYRLKRDELQGVIAHELAHINNRDIQFMTLAAVMIGSIVILSDLIRRSLWYGGRGSSRRSSRDNNQAQLILMIVAVVVVILAPILARILYYASSRKREFLADACGAQYTRYPEGLASALEKISNSGISLSSSNRVMAAMCIVNPQYAAAASEPSSIFSTHPKTSERIGILRSMGGSGLDAYNAAYVGVKGKGVIGSRSLADASSLPVREGSNEGPIESRHDSRGTALRRSGYVDARCHTCDATMSIAPTYHEDAIICIRCGTSVALPTAAPEEPTGAAPRPGIIPGGADILKGTLVPELVPLHYVRTTLGWETFRCSCGGSVQLSPSFAAPQTACPRCKRKIMIGQPAPV